MKRDALELAVDYYNIQLELKERLAIFEEIIEQFCMDAEAQLAPQQEPKYKVTVVDDQHPNGVPLAQWCNPQQPNHTEHPLEMVRKPFGYVTPGGEFRKTPEAANAYEWGQKFIAVYTLPQLKPLTDEQCNDLVMENLGPHALTGGKMSVYDAFLLAVRATEKAHGIKDNT
jgi:hypothetical protein